MHTPLAASIHQGMQLLDRGGKAWDVAIHVLDIALIASELDPRGGRVCVTVTVTSPSQDVAFSMAPAEQLKASLQLDSAFHNAGPLDHA